MTNDETPLAPIPTDEQRLKMLTDAIHRIALLESRVNDNDIRLGSHDERMRGVENLLNAMTHEH